MGDWAVPAHWGAILYQSVGPSAEKERKKKTALLLLLGIHWSRDSSHCSNSTVFYSIINNSLNS